MKPGSVHLPHIYTIAHGIYLVEQIDVAWWYASFQQHDLESIVLCWLFQQQDQRV
jgi:hypothetical protein